MRNYVKFYTKVVPWTYEFGSGAFVAVARVSKQKKNREYFLDQAVEEQANRVISQIGTLPVVFDVPDEPNERWIELNAENVVSLLTVVDAFELLFGQDGYPAYIKDFSPRPTWWHVK